MKTTRTLLLMMAFGLLAFAARADGATTNKLYVTWDLLPQYSTNDMFYVHSHTNATAPPSTWPVWTNVTFTFFVNASNRVPIPEATGQQRYFTFCSSNVTGRSDFADPVSVWRAYTGSGLRLGAY